MITVVKKDKILDYLVRRYDLLSKTGYTKHMMTKWYLCYVFLIDFYEWMFPYITKFDLKAIEHLLVKLFGCGNCLVPYENISDTEVQIARYIGNVHYVGPPYTKMADMNELIRETENK